MMVFVRVSAMLAIFPIFSSANIPIQLRIALGALVAFLVSTSVPPLPSAPVGFGGLVALLAMEVCIGLLLGFISRMIFYALDAAGNVVATEIGLMLSADFNPLSGVRSDAPSMLLNYLAVVLFFTFDMHHWFLLALQKSYNLVPIGAARLSEALFNDVVARTAGIFVVAVQISAPVIAVSFIVTLVFSILGRAVPQMNVFGESFAFRILAGLAVFGLTLNLTAQHISNYLHRLPEDVLHVAQLLGVG
jgi:flagellar biosynthetic protein FliR